MTCRICGRKLRNPASQELGYGPVCYRTAFGSSPPRRGRTGKKEDKAGADISSQQIPGQMDIFAFPEFLPEQ